MAKQGMSVLEFYARNYPYLKTTQDNVYMYIRRYKDYLVSEKIILYRENFSIPRYVILDEKRLLDFFMQFKDKVGVVKRCQAEKELANA